tara:strand:- start:171 stop:350 length:180 start_codon:yes stop_codon:yes gene_type:complete
MKLVLAGSGGPVWDLCFRLQKDGGVIPMAKLHFEIGDLVKVQEAINDINAKMVEPEQDS